MRARFPRVNVHFTTADFTRPLGLPPLDGIVMANALHFLRDKESVARAIKGYLGPAGRFILVEYNADRGHMWVPYPISFPTWQLTAQRSGFATTKLLASVPSRFLGQIYSALSE